MIMDMENKGHRLIVYSQDRFSDIIEKSDGAYIVDKFMFRNSLYRGDTDIMRIKFFGEEMKNLTRFVNKSMCSENVIACEFITQNYFSYLLSQNPSRSLSKYQFKYGEWRINSYKDFSVKYKYLKNPNLFITESEKTVEKYDLPLSFHMLKDVTDDAEYLDWELGTPGILK